MKTLIFREMILLFMDLFILRHGKAGKAINGPEDAERALTREGKEGINRVAKWMKDKNFRFDTIATSPLKRARQTAAIVASELGQEDRLAVWDELAPGGDPDTVCYNASQQGNDAAVLIVGHEPALSGLISRIISGEGDSSIVLAKGGLAKIGNYSFKTRPSGDLQWLVSPKLIRKTR
jgi:phosphohistidine phosphatase